MKETHRKREYSLDLLKIVATTLILLVHYRQNFTGGGNYTLIPYTTGSFYMGNIIELFFMLSGFFTLHLIERSGPFPEYIGKRLRRLWPVMIVAAIADQLLLIVYMVSRDGRLFSGRELSLWGTIISALGIQNIGVFYNQSVNNPTWYLSILILCYILAFLWNRASARTGVPAVYFYIMMIVIGASALTREWNAPLLNSATARGYVAFFVGLCLSMLCEHYEIHKNRTILWGALGFTALFWILFFIRPQVVVNDQRFLCDFLLWPSLILIFKSPVATKVLHYSWLGKWSEISYSTYVWHANVVKCLFILMPDATVQQVLSARLPMLLYCICCWLVGALSWKFIERPAAKYIDRVSFPQNLFRHSR